MKVLVTGIAGFIGYHVFKTLHKVYENIEIVGIDNINDYYDNTLKIDRLKDLGFDSIEIQNWDVKLKSKKYENGFFYRMNIEDEEKIELVFNVHKFDYVIHLAAQAGVRYSLIHPMKYIDSNIKGFQVILTNCKNYDIKHLMYASSSSVYGNSKKMPLSETDRVDNPISIYAATKKANELMAHVYSHLYNIPTTGLRFFTVYGPWGRPDMAIYLFTKNIIEEKPISVFNYGKLKRDFTYIDDICSGIIKLLESNKKEIYEIHNIGLGKPIELEIFIDILENTLNKRAIKNYMPMQPGDVEKTFADTKSIEKAIQYTPNTSVEKGLLEYVTWFKNYYKIS